MNFLFVAEWKWLCLNRFFKSRLNSLLSIELLIEVEVLASMQHLLDNYCLTNVALQHNN